MSRAIWKDLVDRASRESNLIGTRNRDELCRNGDVLSSPALSYTSRDLTAAVDALRQEKLPKEQSDDDLESKEAAAPAPATATTGADNSSVSCFWRPLTDQNSTLFSLVFLIRR